MNKFFALILVLVFGGGIGYATGHSVATTRDAVSHGRELCKSHDGPMGFIYVYGDNNKKSAIEFMCNDTNGFTWEGKSID